MYDPGYINNNPEEPAENLPKDAIRILQLSDSHLYADTSRRLVGLNTQETFEQVIALAKETALPADVILATGDIVHDASATGYQRARDYLEQFELPVFCLPGNHDIPETMSYNMESELVSTQRSVAIDDWLLILLDSTIPHDSGGHLSDNELALLRETLAAHESQHALICLHHHPVKVGSAWMDSMALDNPDSFFEIIDQHSNVRGVLWGHIHQIYEGYYNEQVRMMGSPSTCIQFTPDEDDFAVEHVAPGFRWLELYADGSIRSGVKRLAEMPAGLDIKSGGY
ncbi:MAG: 3',5'-cyclic-AMP phosphodiesterase [Chromatiales bacterium]|nr:3',5'-cyclic-AMP phosphodiesterase [Chromatiales bacterium]